MNIKKTILFLTIGTSLIVTACNKEESITQPSNNLIGVPHVNAKIDNGILVFNESKDMDEYLDFINTKSPTEILKIERMNNFISYDSKIKQILGEYEALCETHYSPDQIQNFRTKYAQYITITDSTFEEKHQGLFNSMANSEGYFQIENKSIRIIGNKVYSADEPNKHLLDNIVTGSIPAMVSVSEFNKREVPVSNSRQVNMWQTSTSSYQQKCGRYHRTRWDLSFYSSSGVPPYGASGNGHYTCGFKLNVRNYKRGWTGIWYSQARNNNFNGYYHSSYNNFNTFNDSQHTANFVRYYNAKTWWREWDQSIENHHIWIHHQILPGMWAYTAGTLTYDVCGNRTVNL